MVTYRGAQAIRQEDDAMRKWFALVSAAAAAFEARWTWPTLGRIDGALAIRLREQRDLFDRAMLTGTVAEIETHGGAMCRGYAAACGALERAEAPDDAYMLGSDPATGQRVAIGTQKAAVTRLKELYGDAVVFMTPDEVAMLISASADAAHFIGAVKRLWPGSVVT